MTDEDETGVFGLVGVVKRCWNREANLASAKPAAGTLTVAPPVSLFVELSLDLNYADRNLTFHRSRCI
jgi:hypothetical protein